MSKGTTITEVPKDKLRLTPPLLEQLGIGINALFEGKRPFIEVAKYALDNYPNMPDYLHMIYVSRIARFEARKACKSAHPTPQLFFYLREFFEHFS